MSSKFSSPFTTLLLAVGIAATFSTARAADSPPGTFERPYDRLGDLQVSDLLLEPSFFYSEPKTGHFLPGNSLVSFIWTRDAMISGKITLGTKALLGEPLLYVTTDNDQELGIVEGYAQAEGYMGRARLGLIPVAFGLEGGDVEGSLRFPRSLFWQKRLVPLRDYGACYQINWDGFFTEWEAHDGEGGKDLDNQIWFTARWGWTPSANFKLGASGSTGRTTPSSTHPAGSTVNSNAWIDVDQPSRTRIVNAFVDWTVHPVEFSAEAMVGETLQDGNALAISAGHADVYWSVSESWAALARWDQYNAKSDKFGTDWTQEMTLGGAWRSSYETSVIYLYFSKAMQKDVSPDEHVVRVVWRLTPYIRAGR